MNKSSISIQLKVSIRLLLSVVGATCLLIYLDRSIFQRFIGEVNPIVAILLSGTVGLLLLSFLLAKNGFAIFKTHHLKKALWYSWLVGLFVSVAILVDLKSAFPQDMNVPLPLALLFYPIIAFFVEMIFHVLPLALLLPALTSIFKPAIYVRVLWFCIIMVALLEPTYQALNMTDSPTWAVIIVWLNLFAFNLAQLWVFNKFDFLSMYAFRLFYYLIWHILWGHFRLDVLF